MRRLALFTILAALPLSAEWTGDLHRRTAALLEQPARLPEGHLPLSGFSIAADWAPFPTAAEADAAEGSIEWHSAKAGDHARQEACTLGFAALELRKYLGRMSGADPALARTAASKGNWILITTLERLPESYRRRAGAGRLARIAARAESFGVIPLQEDGRTVVLLIGNGRVGALYAVYDFLESLGVRWLGLGDENESVPRRPRVSLPAAYVEQPGFGLRSLYGYRNNRGTEAFFSWMAKNKMNAWGADNLLPGMRKRGLQLYGGNHWLQSEAGIRGNVCLSRPGEADRFITNVVNLLATGLYKDLDFLEYLPLDIGVRCEQDAPLGSPTDRDILLVHRLRQAIRAAFREGRLKRDVPVFFYAYYDTIAPPTRPLPEGFDYTTTSVGFYAMHCLNHALSDPKCMEGTLGYFARKDKEIGWVWPGSAQLYAYLKLWTSGTTPYKGRVGAGDYYSRARLFQIPVPIMSLLAIDLPELHRLGVWDMRYMHATTSHWATKTLTNYQFAQMLWNPGLDVPALLADYFRTRYGAQARTMCDFYFHYERAMANIMRLKDDFSDRLNRIHNLKESLFVWEHLHLEPYHPALNDGVDLEESIAHLEQCAALLNQAGPSPAVTEDRDWFAYSDHTMRFYLHMARTYIRKVAGDRPGAVREFAAAERYATLLRAFRLPILIDGVHQPNQADALGAAVLDTAYNAFRKEFGDQK